MGKMRVYEYAKKNNVTSKEVIEQLAKLDVQVTNHMASINQEVCNQLDRTFNQKESTPKKDEPQKQAQKSAKGKQQETREKMEDKKKKNQPKNKKQRGKQRNRPKQQRQEQPKEKVTPEHIVYHETLTVDDLAEKLNKDVSEIIKKLMFLGVMATKNQDLDDDTVELICSDYNDTVKKEII